jgi:hypothetical protein
MKPSHRRQQEPKANKIICRLPVVVTGDPMMLWSKSVLQRTGPDASSIARLTLSILEQ